MASPRELVDTVAEALGVPAPTIVVHDRNLAIAGLRPSGGRGRAAAKANAFGAANNLLAVLGCSVAFPGRAIVTQTISAVEKYAGLPGHMSDIYNSGDNSSKRWQLPAFPIAALQTLSANHSFRDALVALIDAAADGSLANAGDGITNEADRKLGIPTLWQIEVTMYGPSPQAKIAISCGGVFREDHHYGPEFPSDYEAQKQFIKDQTEAHGDGDLKQICQFTQATIVALGNLLGDSDD